MELYFHQVRETFHLMNDKISYIMKVLSNGMLAQMYFGKGIADRPLFDYLLELSYTIFHDEPALSRSARFHRLYRTRLARGVWRDRPRPILLNHG